MVHIEFPESAGVQLAQCMLFFRHWVRSSGFRSGAVVRQADIRMRAAQRNSEFKTNTVTRQNMQVQKHAVA